MPGTFTNQIQAAFRELWLLVVAGHRIGVQPLTETSYIYQSTMAMYNTDSVLCYGDISTLCHNRVLTQWVCVDADLGRSECV